MAVKATVDNIEGTHFITFTSPHSLPLFKMAKSYKAVYKWFYQLKTKEHHIKGHELCLIIYMHWLILEFQKGISIQL
jgi:hypothetical protein